MSNVVWHHRPSLRQPVLVCAFRGFNDGGQAATLSAMFLRERHGAERLCDLDPEDFYDFQEVRPKVSLVEGRVRRIDWPENSFAAAQLPGLDRDVAVLLGIEPQNRWKTYSRAIVEVAHAIGTTMVVTLGGVVAETPHSRPVPVTGTADAELAERLGLTPSTYEGPTGIVGVLHDACRQAGLESVSLWAAVPHYISVTPNPKAALALIERLSTLLEVRFDTLQLSQEALTFERQVGRAVAADEDISKYVRQLEERSDTLGDEFGELPTGEALAQQFERFLAEQALDDDDTPD